MEDETIDCGKVLIEGMDLSGKSTVATTVGLLTKVQKIKQRTLSEKTTIYDFTVNQSKLGNLPQDIISKLYCLAISEDLENYKVSKNGIVLQDSYFALRSYALAQQNKNTALANEIYELLKQFPKPELSFYLTATTEERVKRNFHRDKPMAYMEKLLLSNPKKFEGIEKHLRECASELFDVEVIDTSEASQHEIAEYVKQKIDDEIYEERTY